MDVRLNTYVGAYMASEEEQIKIVGEMLVSWYAKPSSYYQPKPLEIRIYGSDRVAVMDDKKITLGDKILEARNKTTAKKLAPEVVAWLRGGEG